jgi:hypothetical protein
MRSMKRLMPGAVLVALFLGCGESSTSPGDSGGGGQVPPAVLLRDVVIPNLPSPYYHFEYDATGRVTAASFASGFTMYQVIYQGDRISELRNNTLGNQDRLEYTYDGAGRVTRINYVRPNDSVFTRLALTYAGEKLASLERQRLLSGTFVVDKTMAFSYYPDGNLEELTEHHPAIGGMQPEATTLDRFEQYDARSTSTASACSMTSSSITSCCYRECNCRKGTRRGSPTRETASTTRSTMSTATTARTVLSPRRETSCT